MERNYVRVGFGLSVTLCTALLWSPRVVAGAPFQFGDVTASVSKGTVQHYDGSGNLLEVLDTGNGRGVSRKGCAFDSTRNLYVKDFNGNGVFEEK